MPRTSDLLAITALICLLLGIGALAGLWWAVLAAAPVFGWLAYLANDREQKQLALQAAERLERERASVESRERR